MTVLGDWYILHPHVRLWTGDITIYTLKQYLGPYQYGVTKKISSAIAKRNTHHKNHNHKSFNNFHRIRQMLHLNNNARAFEKGNINFDVWHKIRPVGLLDHLNPKLKKKHFQHNQTISIDEAMWK